MAVKKRTRRASETPRRRRTPEEARAEILAAAERLFAARGPDAVGIQQIAREAGVSHPLVVHYFGSYEALVREVLRSRNQRLRDRLLAIVAEAGGSIDGTGILTALLSALSDPAHARLLAWAALSGEAANLPFVKNQAARRLAEVLEARMRQEATAAHRAPPTRARLDRAFLVGASAALGFATFRSILLPGLGHALDEAADRSFEAALRDMLRDQLMGDD